MNQGCATLKNQDIRSEAGADGAERRSAASTYIIQRGTFEECARTAYIMAAMLALSYL